MSDKPKTEKAEKTPPEPQGLVKLQHVAKGNWTLSIEGVDYPVTDGAVEVPAHHVPAAQQAGFRPVA
ncbi:MAG TPA: hypothetical protein VGQ93_00045 [Lysobacter sp.]|jgi:hypothetical protein|nr:hypothetical protein [Lysobacter sp.]